MMDFGGIPAWAEPAFRRLRVYLPLSSVEHCYDETGHVRVLNVKIRLTAAKVEEIERELRKIS